MEMPPKENAIGHETVADEPTSSQQLQKDIAASGAGQQIVKNEHHHNVPLVQLELQNITYSPLSKSVTASSSRPWSSKPESRTTVLHNISTQIMPYQVCAWMGPSGSGKTSLLTVAANLMGHDKGALSPDSTILVNGEDGELPKRLVGVVWQDDLLLSNLTVRENIWYAARLKTPQNVSDVVVRQLVQETLEDLDLGKVQDSLVGGINRRGISGGERKRVAVASELVIRPSLLFLDEPTSGLDATTALALMHTLKTLARSQGHSIVTVIHQPRTTIFNQYIDSLLLLSRGRVVYNGHPSKVRSYLEESCGGSVAPLPPETGIADWIMDIIKDDEQRQQKQQQQQQQQKQSTTFNEKEDGSRCLADYWEKNSKGTSGTVSADCTSVLVEAVVEHDGKTEARPVLKRMSTLKELEAMPNYNMSFWAQFKLLTMRTSKQQRGERLTATAAAMQLAYFCFTALFWWRLPNTTRFVYERISLLFFMIVAQSNAVVVSAVTVFATERTLLRRERSKKMYGVASYFLAKTISDMTNNVLLPLVYVMCVYWTAGFRLSGVAYFKYILTYYFTMSTAQSMGLAISVAIPNLRTAVLLAPAVTLFFIIMGGFYVPFENMNKLVRWISWLSFCRYGYSALIINEYGGRDIPCDDDLDGVVAIGGTASTCPLPGEEVISSLGIHGVPEGFWFSIGMVATLQIIFRVGAYWMLRRSH